jgi:hypothetical protein
MKIFPISGVAFVFRGVMNWTIGEDRFPLCSFLGGFLQIVTLAITDYFR